MKKFACFHLVALCTVVLSSVLFVSCASAENKSNADDIRAKANVAYDSLDGEFNDQPSQNGSVAPTATENAGVAQAEPGKPLLEQLSQFSCPSADYIRGQGTGKNPAEARLSAQTDIALQIQSSLVSQMEFTKKSSVDAYGEETLEEAYAASTETRTSLKNAQDAKVVASLVQGEAFGSVACMSRPDAAKPYLNELAKLREDAAASLKIFNENKHPRECSKAFKQARKIFGKMILRMDVVRSLGVPYDDSISEEFSAAQKRYSDMRSRFVLHYAKDPGEEGADAGEKIEIAKLQKLFFERLSKDFSLVESECDQGLLLKMSLQKIKCKESSFGTSCALDATLSGYSCSGEKFFDLNASVKGTGRYDESEAKERIEKSLLEGDWYEPWKNELKNWVLE